MIRTEPKLKPLISDLNDLNIESFLASNDYNRLMIENNFENLWDTILELATKSRTIFSLDMNMKEYDSKKAFELLTTNMFKKDIAIFNNFILIVIKGFIQFREISKEDFEKIKIDLKLINFPEEKMQLLYTIFDSANHSIKTKKHKDLIIMPNNKLIKLEKDIYQPLK